MGADTLLPDKKTQKYRQEQLPNKEKLKNNVALALSKMPFKQVVYLLFKFIDIFNVNYPY
jgi:hypothetical protein